MRGDMLLPDAGDDKDCGERGSFRQSDRLHPIAAIIARAVAMNVKRFFMEVTGNGTWGEK